MRFSFDLQQLGTGADMYCFRGQVPVQYTLQITNPTSETLTLQRLNLETVGSGAYRLRTGDSPFNYTIPPNSMVTIPLSASAFAPGGFLRGSEPVNIRGLAYIKSSNGTFVKQFTEYLPQQ